MKFLSTWLRNLGAHEQRVAGRVRSSMKFLSTWLRNLRGCLAPPACCLQFLNEVPEHMAQEYRFIVRGFWRNQAPQ